MSIKRTCKISVVLFLFAMVFNLFSLKSVTVKADTVAEHERKKS